MHDIEHELKEHEKSLFSVAKEYRSLARDAATKRVIYDVAWANAIETISQSDEKLTVPQKDAKATIMVQFEMSECRTAEANLDAAKKYIDVMQAMLSSVQTRAKLSQMEMARAR